MSEEMVQVAVDACGNKVMAKMPTRPPSHTGGTNADGTPTEASPHDHQGSRLGNSHLHRHGLSPKS